jgi:Tat protein secretion system quality control protein TatD with DNase activity
MRHEEAAAQWLRQARGRHKGVQHLAARMIEIGHKLIEAGAFMGCSRWLSWRREHREAAMPTGDTTRHH